MNIFSPNTSRAGHKKDIFSILPFDVEQFV